MTPSIENKNQKADFKDALRHSLHNLSIGGNLAPNDDKIISAEFGKYRNEDDATRQKYAMSIAVDLKLTGVIKDTADKNLWNILRRLGNVHPIQREQEKVNDFIESGFIRISRATIGEISTALISKTNKQIYTPEYIERHIQSLVTNSNKAKAGLDLSNDSQEAKMQFDEFKAKSIRDLQIFRDALDQLLLQISPEAQKEITDLSNSIKNELDAIQHDPFANAA